VIGADKLQAAGAFQISHLRSTTSLYTIVKMSGFVNIVSWARRRLATAPENWERRLTEAGAAAAADRHPNPDDPAGYLVRLREIPHMSSLVREYATEALQAYNARLYRASAVMLGVASEAAVLEAAEGLAAILNDTERQQFLDQMGSPKLNMVAKFSVFQQKMRSHRDRLPKQVADSLELTVHAVAEFLRVSRNDAGHPTGVKISVFRSCKCSSSTHGSYTPSRRDERRSGYCLARPRCQRRGIMFERLPTTFPNCDSKHLDALAAVWTREATLVISRMFEIYAETEIVRRPIEVRHEAAFELAKLTLWLEDRMIEKKTAALPIDQISPEAEAQFITSPVGIQRIDNTARIMADRIWKPLCSKWWERYPAIPAVPRKKVVRGVPTNSPGVKSSISVRCLRIGAGRPPTEPYVFIRLASMGESS
jgi:hypothetical protein